MEYLVQAFVNRQRWTKAYDPGTLKAVGCGAAQPPQKQRARDSDEEL